MRTYNMTIILYMCEIRIKTSFLFSENVDKCMICQVFIFNLQVKVDKYIKRYQYLKFYRVDIVK